MIPNLILAGLEQSLILAIVALAVYLPFRVLNQADMTPDGTFTIGAASTAALMLAGFDAITSTIGSCLVASAFGAISAQIITKFKINSLLAGIIVSTGLYSINLRLMGRPNLSLLNIDSAIGISDQHTRLALFLTLNAALFLLLVIYFKTKSGLKFKAVGLNPKAANRYGINVNRHILTGFMFANALAGLSGSIMAQTQLYADIGMGVGIVVYALASIMIGEMVIGQHIIAPLVGAIIFQQLYGLAISIGLNPGDIKLIVASIVLGCIFLGKYKLQIKNA